MQRFNLKQFLQRFIDEPEKCKLFETLDRLPRVNAGGPWIAGGAIRKTIQKKDIDSDFDFFFKNEMQRLDFEVCLQAMGFKEISKTDHQTTFSDGKIEVQCIHFQYYDSAEAVIDSFDFTITQFAYDGSDLICGEFSLWDLARARLAIHKLTFGVSTVRRLIKYSQQGFTACGGVLADILQRTVDNPQSMQKDIKYID